MHTQLITAALALASSAFAVKLPSVHTTSTMTLYAPRHTESTSTAEHHSACTVCPKDYDRNWNSDRVLNDTRKHHSSFKLFAYPDDADSDDAGIPVHVVTHGESRANMWQLKLGDPMNGDAKSQKDQPKWNLHDNSLQTDGSAPINKTLYFRLYDGKYPKDTENWTGTVFHPIATTMKNKKKYKNENNAELIVNKGWSLVREDENPFAYTLKGSKPAGNFFACVIPDDMKDAMSTLPPTGVFDEEADPADMVDLVSTMMSMVSKLEIVYSEEQPKQEFATAGNGLVDPKGCFPITIKAEGWTHPKQT